MLSLLSREMGRDTLHRHLLQWLWFLPLAALLIWGVGRSQKETLGDFGNYYFSALLQSQGRLPEALYDPAAFNQAIEDAGYQDIFVSYSPHTPAVAFLFQPVIWFSPTNSKLIFNILGSSLLLLFFIRWFHVFNIPFRWAVVLPLLFYKPLLANLFQGQIYFYLLICLVEWFRCLAGGRFYLASLLGTTAVLLKLFPALVFLFLLAGRAWKASILFFIASVLALLFFIGVQGVDIWRFYVFDVLPHASQGASADAFAVSFQSWNVLFARLLTYDAVANPHPWMDAAIAPPLCLFIVRSAVVGLSAGNAVRNALSFAAFTTVVLAGMLLTPTGSGYSLVLLVIPFCSALSQSSQANAFLCNPLYRQGLVLLLCGAICWWPAAVSMPVPFARLFLLTTLWLTCLHSADYQWKYVLTSMFFFLPGTWASTNAARTADPSTPLPIASKEAILADYSFANQQLIAYYRRQSGRYVVTYPFPFSTADSTAVHIRFDSVFVDGRLVLYTPDKKKKAILVDGNTLLYLSTKHKGPGFYSLRTLTLNHAP